MRAWVSCTSTRIEGQAVVKVDTALDMGKLMETRGAVWRLGPMVPRLRANKALTTGGGEPEWCGGTYLPVPCARHKAE